MHVLEPGILVAALLRNYWRVIIFTAVVIIGGLAIAWALTVPAADWLATHDVGSVTGTVRALRLQTARDAARGRLLTFGAGVLAAGALFFTALNFILSRRTFELAEQGQVTDRYTKAIEQLGADKLDVRIGGIYALERVARDSARDHPTVMEVLAAFVREHSREQWPEAEPGAEPPQRATRPDVQAAVTVMGRRNREYDSQSLYLAGVQLRGAILTGADLRRVDLGAADLSGANLNDANLGGANLTAANLTDAYLFKAALYYAGLNQAGLGKARLVSADLRNASLIDADLTDANLNNAKLNSAILSGAILSGAKLQATNLTDADLTGADLTDAQFNRADLTGADLTHADLSNADLTDARWAPDPRPPAKWVRDPDSGRLRRASEDTGDAGERQ
jgi:hypothetical protein